MLFEFAPQAYGAVGVNVRSEEVAGVLAYLDGAPIVTASRGYQADAGADVVPLALEIIHELVAASPLPADRLAGVGLAVPGLVVESINWGWKDLPCATGWRSRLRCRFPWKRTTMPWPSAGGLKCRLCQGRPRP